MSNDTRSVATECGLWRDAYREFLKTRTITFAWVTVALFVVAMTIFGPLGTSADLRPLRRFLYWGLSAVVTFPLCYATAAVTLYVMRSRSLVETVPAVASTVLFEGIVCTIALHTADGFFRPHYADPASLGPIYVTVTTVVAVCTFFIHYVVFQRVRHSGPVPAEDRSPSGSRGTAVTTEPPSGSRSTPGTAEPPASSGGPPGTTEPPSGSRGTPGTTEPPSGSGGTPGTTEPPSGSGGPPGTTEPPSSSGGTPGATEPPAGNTAGERGGDRSEAATRPQPPDRQARFYDRLSPAVSRDIIYVTVDDHYVEVHTTGGSCLILMNFGTAVADLGDLGMQVHRSYWVARRHVTATARRDGRTMLRVTGGHLIPVSRTYLPAVREALRIGARKPNRPG